MRAALGLLLVVALQPASAISLGQDDIFRLAEVVCRGQVLSISELHYFDDGTSIWSARLKALGNRKGKPVSSEFTVYFQAPAVKFCPPNSLCNTVDRCPPFVELKTGEEVTLALSYRDFGGFEHVLVLSQDGCIIHAGAKKI